MWYENKIFVSIIQSISKISYCFFVLSLFVAIPTLILAKDSPKAAATPKKQKHFLAIHKALDSIDNWTNEEVDFYLQKCSRNPKLQSNLLARFNSLVNKKEISDTRKKFIHDLLNMYLATAIQKRFHEPQEIVSILHSFRLVQLYEFKDLFYKILPFIAHPMDNVREASYPVIKSLSKEKVFPVLMSLAVSKKAIDRIFVIKAFEALSDKRAISYLTKSLRDKNKSVRFFSVSALKHLNMTKSVAVFKRMAMYDKSIDVRLKALQTLKDVKTPSAFFATFLNDPDPRIRYTAVVALHDSRTARPVGAKLSGEKNCKVKLKMLQTLVELGTTGGFPQATHSILTNNTCDAEVSLWMLYAFKKFGYSKYSHLIMPYLSHKNQKVREEAAWTLQNMPIDEKTKTLLNKIIFSKEKNLYTRSAALYALLSTSNKQERQTLEQQANTFEKFPILLLNIFKQK